MVAIARQTDIPAAPAENDFRTLLRPLKPISLDELGQGNLQDRIDTKFLFSALELPSLIEALALYYRILEIDGVRLHGYQTLYFDTSDFVLYQAQHAGRLDRYKVRSRRYVETRQSFLEVKHKNRRDRTVKSRIPTGTLLTELDDEAMGFIHGHLPRGSRLEAKLWNRFSRITFAHLSEPERITLDLNVAFGTELITTAFPGVVVAELKQESLNRGSIFLREMRLRGIHETGFSKYCIGAAVLNDELKHNRFKPEILRARRMSERYLNR